MNTSISAANTNATEIETITVNGKITQIRNVNDVFGNPQIGHHVTIVDRECIVLFGIDLGRVKGALPYSRGFAVGDVAEYGSYNMSYTGTITKITTNRVTIVDGQLTRSLKIGDFARRNRHFTAAAAEIRNAAWND